jgi:hypothetical protein
MLTPSLALSPEPFVTAPEPFVMTSLRRDTRLARDLGRVAPLATGSHFSVSTPPVPGTAFTRRGSISPPREVIGAYRVKPTRWEATRIGAIMNRSDHCPACRGGGLVPALGCTCDGNAHTC